MTAKTLRRTILIERHEVTVKKLSENRVPIYCERCRSEVVGLEPTEIVMRLTQPDALSSGDDHFVETIDGRLSLVCSGVSESDEKIPD